MRRSRSSYKLDWLGNKRFVLTRTVSGLGVAQALPNQLEVSLGCGDPLGRFLLERMKDVEDTLEAHRVDRAISVAVEVVANFQDAAAKALQGLRVRGMLAKLGLDNGCADLRCT